MKKDPICGMSVDASTAKFSANHNGETYYFCSETCKTEFLLRASNTAKKKGFFKRFLEWLAKSNEEQFHGKPPTCH
jgi:YHS domain-containing protein